MEPSFTSIVEPSITSTVKPSFTSTVEPSFSSMAGPSITSIVESSFTSIIEPSFTSIIKFFFTSTIEPSNVMKPAGVIPHGNKVLSEASKRGVASTVKPSVTPVVDTPPTRTPSLTGSRFFSNPVALTVCWRTPDTEPRTPDIEPIRVQSLSSTRSTCDCGVTYPGLGVTSFTLPVVRRLRLGEEVRAGPASAILEGCLGGIPLEGCLGGIPLEGCLGGIPLEECLGGIPLEGCLGGIPLEGCLGGIGEVLGLEPD